MIIDLALARDSVWITDPDGTSLCLKGEWPDPESRSSVDAEVRDYAGRRRVISTRRRSGSVALTLILVDEPALAQLEKWKGKVLLLRSALWRRWGMYAEVVSVPLYSRRGLHDQRWRVALQWTDTDFDESA